MANDQDALDLIWKKYRTALIHLERALDELESKPKEIEVIKEVEKIVQRPFELPLTDDDSDNAYTGRITKDAVAGFGEKFPDFPDVGELFLRVDFKPHRLFKWNGKLWSELADSSETGGYVFNESYIKYMTREVIQGRLQLSNLSIPEKEAVLNNTNYNQQQVIASHQK